MKLLLLVEKILKKITIVIYEKTSTFLAKTTTSVCPTSQFLSEIIIKKNYAKSKIPNEKKQKIHPPHEIIH